MTKPEVETKEERFVRIAEARTTKIIDMVKLLGNCSNRANYEYSKEDVKKVFNAIEEELRIAKAKFEMSDSSEKRFTLR